MALDIVAVLVLTPLDVQIAFGVRPPRNVRPRPAARIPSTAPDVEILRAFEPIVRYTQGEKFFPMDVERYLREASLWLYVPDGSDEEVVPEGELTMESLVQRREAPFGSLFYLRFIQALDLQESARALAGERRLAKEQQSDVPRGRRPARARRPPAAARRRALLALAAPARERPRRDRGRSRAQVRADPREQDEKYIYQGRVARQSGWTICQYWFFFAYNPWRSGFHGVNDHESDWEMISVYLYEDDGRLVPEWVAYASHDFHGADLRRRWDDRHRPRARGRAPGRVRGRRVARLVLQGGRVPGGGADPGSARASRGSPRRSAGSGGRRSARATRRAARCASRSSTSRAATGSSIGPGQPNEWTPNVIDETTPWVGKYRGLWGLYAQDPISGENAPAGPMYERDGSPRPSWFDPLAFAGLDQVPPPPDEVGVLEAELARLEARQSELDALIPEETTELRELGVRLQSMLGSPHLAAEAERLERGGGRAGVEAHGSPQGALRERGRARGAAAADRAPARTRGRRPSGSHQALGGAGVR